MATVAVLLLTLVPVASAYDINVGSVTSTGPSKCSVSLDDQEENVENEKIVIKASIEIEEDNTREDDWTVNMDVEWDVVPIGASDPGARDAEKEFGDTYGVTDTISSEIKTEWSSGEFDTIGTYEASVSVSLLHEDSDWDGTVKSTLCEASGTAKVIINWLDGTCVVPPGAGECTTEISV